MGDAARSPPPAPNNDRSCVNRCVHYLFINRQRALFSRAPNGPNGPPRAPEAPRRQARPLPSNRPRPGSDAAAIVLRPEAGGGPPVGSATAEAGEEGRGEGRGPGRRRAYQRTRRAEPAPSRRPIRAGRVKKGRPMLARPLPAPQPISARRPGQAEIFKSTPPKSCFSKRHGARGRGAGRDDPPSEPIGERRRGGPAPRGARRPISAARGRGERRYANEGRL